MSYTKTRISDDLRKNKPNIIYPIISTMLAFFVLIFLIVLFATSKGQFPVSLFIFCLIVVILYPVASWLNSYVLKKMNLKKITNYENETDVLIKYVRRYDSYRAYEYPKDIKLTFNVEQTNIIGDEAPKFNVDNCSFRVPENSCILMTLGVSFAGIEINRETHKLERISGVMPRSIWYNKKLKAPNAKKAVIKVDFNGFKIEPKMVIHALKRADSYYDNKTGWLVVGERKTTIIDDAYEISKDVIIVLRDQELMSVWIKIEPGLMVK